MQANRPLSSEPVQDRPFEGGTVTHPQPGGAVARAHSVARALSHDAPDARPFRDSTTSVMSNGSRPGRDSTGTSDTILSGTSKSQKCRQQSSRLWVDKGAFWETLEPTDQSVTLGNSAQHLLFELKVRRPGPGS